MEPEEKNLTRLSISIFMWIVKGLGYLWVVLFVGWLIEYLLVGIVPTRFCSALRFPLGSPDGIAVDNNGKVYCASHFYNRIQVYDTDGKFIYGWFSFIRGGLDIILDSNNLIHVEQRDKYAVYTTDGVLLQKRSKEFYQKKLSAALEAKDALGNTYIIEGNYLMSKVIKINPEEKKVKFYIRPMVFVAYKCAFSGFWLYISGYSYRRID